MVLSPYGLHNVRGGGRSTAIIIASAAVNTLLFLTLTASTNNNALLQSQSAFAQQQEEGGGSLSGLFGGDQQGSGNQSGSAPFSDLFGGGDNQQGGEQQQEERVFLPYSNPVWGILIQYPSDWAASTSALRDYTELIAFYSPLQNLSQPIAARVAISAVQFAQNVSLPHYTELVLTGVYQSELVLKNSSEATLAGYPGYRIVLANTPFQNSTLVVYHMNTWTIIGNKVYHLTYEAEESAFNQHLPEVSQMLESFRIASNLSRGQQQGGGPFSEPFDGNQSGADGGNPLSGLGEALQ
jgi:hypothetical protein